MVHGLADLQKTKGHRTELQQQRLQVCEKNWVRKIVRVTRADRGRMVELRQTTQESG